MKARLEALITIPDAFEVDITEHLGGSLTTATVAAGTYYPTAFLAAFQAALRAASFNLLAYIVTGDFGAGGTGKVNIACGGEDVDFDFGVLANAQLIGFTSASFTIVDNETGANGMLGVWLPDCATSGKGNLDFKSKGHRRTDAAYSQGPTGKVTLWEGNARYSFRGITWTMINEERAIDGADAAVVSWSQFVRQTQDGGHAAFVRSAGGEPVPVKFYYDADNNLLLGANESGDGEYRMVLEADKELAQQTEGWVGAWTVTIRELVKT